MALTGARLADAIVRGRQQGAAVQLRTGALRTAADLSLPRILWGDGLVPLADGGCTHIIKTAWMDRWGRSCLFCGVRMVISNEPKSYRATIDHINARALGGEDRLANLQVICSCCNELKSYAERNAVDWERRPVGRAVWL